MKITQNKINIKIMRKICYLIPLLLLVLASCSNDDDVSAAFEDLAKNRKYDVSLSVKSPSLVVEENPFTKAGRALEIDQFYFLRAIVYNKETGAYQSQKVISDLPSIMKDDNTIPITLELPKGNYTVAVFLNKEKEEDFTKWLEPNNFNTDYFGGEPISKDGSNLLKPTTNDHQYYESIDISVAPNSTTEVGTISLKPMWADVRVYFTQMDETIFPEGADMIRLIYKNHYYGFGLKDKLATKISPSITGEAAFAGYYTYDILPLPADAQYRHIYIAEGANKQIEFTLEYLKNNGNNTWSIIKSNEYKLDNTIEVKNGYKYDVFGKLPDNGNSQSLGLSIGEFNSNTIIVPIK